MIFIHQSYMLNSSPSNFIVVVVTARTSRRRQATPCKANGFETFFSVFQNASPFVGLALCAYPLSKRSSECWDYTMAMLLLKVDQFLVSLIPKVVSYGFVRPRRPLKSDCLETLPPFVRHFPNFVGLALCMCPRAKCARASWYVAMSILFLERKEV